MSEPWGKEKISIRFLQLIANIFSSSFLGDYFSRVTSNLKVKKNFENSKAVTVRKEKYCNYKEVRQCGEEVA